MLSIRLARNGAKKRPFYHIVVSENDRIPTGRAIEVLGFVNPIASAGETVRIDAEKAKAWIAKGAQPSKTVLELLQEERDPAVAARQSPPGRTQVRPGWSWIRGDTMDFEAFLIDVLTPILDSPEALRVEVKAEGRKADVLIYADPRDRGRIIGKSGRMISSLRPLVKAAGEKAGLHTVNLELFDGDEGEGLMLLLGHLAKIQGLKGEFLLHELMDDPEKLAELDSLVLAPPSLDLEGRPSRPPRRALCACAASAGTRSGPASASRRSPTAPPPSPTRAGRSGPATPWRPCPRAKATATTGWAARCSSRGPGWARCCAWSRRPWATTWWS